MDLKKLAIIMPGMGYHKDKPLLYYGTKIAMQCGYDILHVDYLEYFKGIKYTDAKKVEAGLKAFKKTEDVLKTQDFSQYEDVVFIGKSFGTLAGAKYVAEHGRTARQIWYTPVLETFDYGPCKAVAFIGSKDPLSDIEVMKTVAVNRGIALHIYDGGNHSLETGDVKRDIDTLREVMKATKEYLSGNDR